MYENTILLLKRAYLEDDLVALHAVSQWDEKIVEERSKVFCMDNSVDISTKKSLPMQIALKKAFMMARIERDKIFQEVSDMPLMGVPISGVTESDIKPSAGKSWRGVALHSFTIEFENGLVLSLDVRSPFYDGDFCQTCYQARRVANSVLLSVVAKHVRKCVKVAPPDMDSVMRMWYRPCGPMARLIQKRFDARSKKRKAGDQSEPTPPTKQLKKVSPKT